MLSLVQDLQEKNSIHDFKKYETFFRIGDQ